MLNTAGLTGGWGVYGRCGSPGELRAVWVGALSGKSAPGQKEAEAVGHGRPLIPFGGAVFPHLEHPASLAFNMRIPEVTGPLLQVGRAMYSPKLN